MVWRTTSLVLLAAQAAWSDEPKWEYARLVDTPLAPAERAPALKIVRVTADSSKPAAGDEKVPDGKDSKQTYQRIMKNSFLTGASVETEATVKAAAPTWRVFVGGEVARVGAYNSQRPLTALQSVIAAGGLKEIGNAKEIVVLRYYDKDLPPKAKRIDLSKSLAGKGADDYWLESHDVLIVPKKGTSLSTEEIVKEVPAPMAEAAKQRLTEKHRTVADANKELEKQLPPLPVK